MSDNLIMRTASAYDYPLLIKNLFLAPVVDNPEQEIVYRNTLRFTYREFRARVCRLANALTRLGVKPGDTVAVMDWDSHRYLECFFDPAVDWLGGVGDRRLLLPARRARHDADADATQSARRQLRGGAGCVSSHQKPHLAASALAVLSKVPAPRY